MKTTIKLLALLVIAVLAVCTFVACGGNKPTTSPEDELTVIVPPAAEIKDGELFAYDENGERVNYTNAFVEVNGDVYFVINNFIVYNQYIYNGAIYNFGNDGKMLRNTAKDGYTYDGNGRLVADNVFITINGDVYFVINNLIVFNQIVIDGYVYNFGDDGKMITGEKDGYTYGEDGKLVANNVFITINGDVYFIINNTIVYNQVIIEGAVYDFGDDGKMVTGEKDGYTYGEDGKLVGNNVFITVNGDVYFIMNNTIVYNQIIINGSIYNFGDDGKMVTGEKDGYTYGEDGKLVAHYIFITINGDVYFIMNNTIVYNQVIINGSVYNFGDDGKMVRGATGSDGYQYDNYGKLVGTNVFITINGNIYYIVNNVIVYNTYIIHDGQVYYMTSSGVRLENAEYDGYYFGANGSIVANNVTITINGVIYHIVNNQVVQKFGVSGTIYESDNDMTLDNNSMLSGVVVTLTVGEESYTTNSDGNGYFAFDQVIQSGDITLSFAREGYKPVAMSIEGSANGMTVVMDRAVSNSLSGTIYIADSDSTITNNSVLSGAVVTLEKIAGSSTPLYSQATTSSTGYYTFNGLTAGVYRLTVSKEGYLPVTQIVQMRYNETNLNNAPIEMIKIVSDAVGYASGKITDALTGNGISGLTVYIYEGINTSSGEAVEVLTTNSNGEYRTTGLNAGNYTAYVVDERILNDENYRYASVTISVKVLSGQTTGNQNATTSNSVGLDLDGMRIVLTWGSSPSDLDSHLRYGNYECYFGSKITPNANLDLDDTSAYGPETITITDVGNYQFNYFVYNFSRSGTMYASQACVKVYFGGSSTPAYTFYPPQGSGYTWNVFTYNAVTGEFIINNTVG